MHPQISTELTRNTGVDELSPWERIPTLPLPAHVPEAREVPAPQRQHSYAVDPAWFQWPCALLAQALLLQQQGWQCASTAVQTLRVDLSRCKDTSAKSQDSERGGGNAQ